MAGRLKAGQATTKLCIRCDRVLPLNKFSKNRLWVDQAYHDCWCRDCAKRLCKTQDDLRIYCFENNRHWEDRYWLTALNKAKKKLATDEKYLKLTGEAQEKAENAKACEEFVTSLANLAPFYLYEEHDFENGEDLFSPAQLKEIDEDKPEYSEEWRGYYTRSEIRQ